MSVLEHFFQGLPLCGAVTFDWRDEIQNGRRKWGEPVFKISMSYSDPESYERFCLPGCLFFYCKKTGNLTAHTSSFKGIISRIGARD